MRQIQFVRADSSSMLHARLGTSEHTICGKYEPTIRDQWVSRGWKATEAIGPECKVCLRLLPKAREFAATLDEETVPDATRPLKIIYAWYKRTPRKFGLAKFKGDGFYISCPDNTFDDLARALFADVIEPVLELNLGYSESFSDHMYLFDLANDVEILSPDLFGDRPDDLDGVEMTVASAIAPGEDGMFTWDLGEQWSLMFRVEAAPVGASATLHRWSVMERRRSEERAFWD